MNLELLFLSPVIPWMVAGGAIVLVAALTADRRRRSRRRVVELPNSHYTAPLARQSETRHRWHSMRLDGVHEINRNEVERLLSKVEATSVQALSPREREFLDNMAALTAR